MGPSFDTRYVTLVLRVGRRHVRMAHLRSRVRIVWIMGRGYVLHRRKWWLKLVVSDNVRLRSVFPRRLGDRLLRAVSLVRSLDLLLVSEKRYISATRNFRTKPHAYERVLHENDTGLSVSRYKYTRDSFPRYLTQIMHTLKLLFQLDYNVDAN